MVYVAVIVVVVLLFTSQTYGEVPVLLLTFVTAMILNQGSNFVFGKISFVSNSVTSILQLALSLDYAVILCNHFKEQHETMPIREAAISCADQIHPGDKRKLPDNGRRSCGNAVYAVQDRPGHGHMSYQGYTLRAFERVCTYAGTAGAVWAAYRENKNFVPKISFVGKIDYATRHVVPVIFVAVAVLGLYFSNRCPYAYGYSSLKTPKLNATQIADNMVADNFTSSNMVALIIPSGDYEKEAELQQIICNRCSFK